MTLALLFPATQRPKLGQTHVCTFQACVGSSWVCHYRPAKSDSSSKAREDKPAL